MRLKNKKGMAQRKTFNNKLLLHFFFFIVYFIILLLFKLILFKLILFKLIKLRKNQGKKKINIYNIYTLNQKKFRKN